MRPKRIEDQHPPAVITDEERAWLARVEREEDDLQRAHYSLIADCLESTSISRAVRAVKLGRGH